VKSDENIEKYVGGKNKLLQYLEKNIENDGKYQNYLGSIKIIYSLNLHNWNIIINISDF